MAKEDYEEYEETSPAGSRHRQVYPFCTAPTIELVGSFCVYRVDMFRLQPVVFQRLLSSWDWYGKKSGIEYQSITSNLALTRLF